jgi:rhodanese-related sulfurtransferase
VVLCSFMQHHGRGRRRQQPRCVPDLYPSRPYSPQVTKQLPKDSRTLVVCQTGVRSLAACSQLAKLGYSPLAVLDGGLNKAKTGELPTIPPGKDPR